MSKLTLTDVTSGYASTTAINANNTLIEAALENTLSRDGTSPNTMNVDLDMNGHRILNLNSLTIGGIDIGLQATNAAASASAASTSASAAATSASAASTSASAAATSASSAAASVIEVQDQKIIWKGPWSGATTYNVNDAVSSGGASYISIATTTNNIPPNATYWNILAEKGTPGAGTGDMLGANNLSDLTNASIARVNLGVQIGVHVPSTSGSSTQVFSVAQATGVTNAVRTDDLQNQTHIKATTGGTSTAFTATLSPVPATYTVGMRMSLTLHATPGASPTININSLGIKNFTYRNSSGVNQFITSTVCPSGHIADCIYDGVDIVVLNPISLPVIATAAEVTTGTNNTKLVTPLAVQGVIGRLIKFTTITASNASWPKQATTTQIVVLCIGGGGNGGNGESGGIYRGGGGGGAGGKVWGYSNSLSSTYAATIGGAGGTTSFGAIASASGGKNGFAGVYGGAGAGDGGDGGDSSVTVTDIGEYDGVGGGAGGGAGGVHSGSYCGGGGGSSNGGGAGGSGPGGAGAVGAANSGAGGGGGAGGGAGGAGGAGGSGVIYVWEFT